MSKPRADSSPAAAEVRPRRPFGEVDLLAIVAVLLCVGLAYLSRFALNPDGVSYLDLAGAVQRGDWQHFVQGYWSPLLPFVTGVISLATGLAGSALVPVTHAFNAVAAVAGVAVLWQWGRQVGAARPLFGRLAIAAFLLCSAGLPRIEAVTPDVVSLLVAICLSRELLTRGGVRWPLVGLLLGASFLVKTSAWPWLLVLVPLRLWVAPDATARRQTWLAAATCALVMLVWVVPMSIKAARPTLGSAGRLNYSWYIQANSSRLPDGDVGTNTAYQQVPIGNGQEITVATFDAAHWTYEPWSDPTAWSEKVLTDVGRAATPGELIGYWLRMFGRVFGLWLGPMLVAVVLPAYLLHRRPGIWREWQTANREAFVIIVLGVVGLLQFVAVHAEPRLLAPYGIMLALGAIWWCTGPRAAPATRPGGRGAIVTRWVLGWVGIAAGLGFAVPKFIEGVDSAANLAATTSRLDELKLRLAADLPGTPTIAIIGPAVPVLSAAYWSGVRVAMQIPPRSVGLLTALPPDRRAALLGTLFGGRVSLIWNTNADGGVQMLMEPRSK